MVMVAVVPDWIICPSTYDNKLTSVLASIGLTIPAVAVVRIDEMTRLVNLTPVIAMGDPCLKYARISVQVLHRGVVITPLCSCL